MEAWAGLWLAALVWAANVLAGQMLPTVDCDHQVSFSALVSLVCTLLALTAGLVSWRAVRRQPSGFGSPTTIRFDAMLSTLSALVFGFALALQTFAALVLSGCER